MTLNNKEQKRLIVLNEVQAGRLTGIEAATMLGLSLRQTRRLLAMYRQAGGGVGSRSVLTPDPATSWPSSSAAMSASGRRQLKHGDGSWKQPWPS
ncbi:MAG TPA: hypothetical protein PLD89_03130 [Promineifilum sp.]|nr:hypothetical protein [Promineifilum sp.]